MKIIELKKVNKIVREQERNIVLFSESQTTYKVLYKIENYYGDTVTIPSNLKYGLEITTDDSDSDLEKRDDLIQWLFDKVTTHYETIVDILNEMKPYKQSQIDALQKLRKEKYSHVLIDFIKFLKINNLSNTKEDLIIKEI